MTNNEIDSYVTYMLLMDELKSAEELGVTLALRGKSSTPEEIARACAFEEENSYMRDYITDRSKETKSINFDLVRNR